MSSYSGAGGGAYRERVEDNRAFWKYLVFGFLTFGIYDIFWCYRLIEDMNIVCGAVETDRDDRSPNYIVLLLLTMVTFGIYGLIWFYHQGDRMRRAGKEYGVEIDEKGSTLLLWVLLGSWLAGIGVLMGWYILMKNTNRLAKAYNYKFIDNADKKEPGRDVPPAGGGGGGNSRDPGIVTDSVSIVGAQGVRRCIKGEYKGQSIDLSQNGSVIIGRSGQYSQLILLDPTVSRKHCLVRFARSENAFYVTDYSSMGTWMNGSIRLRQNVAERCPVGSRLTLGDGKNEFLLQ